MNALRVLVVTWVAGFVAGMLIRTSAGAHGVLAAAVVVALNAGAAGYAWRALGAAPKSKNLPP